MGNALRTDLIDSSPDRFGKSRISFPTPNVADIIFEEEIPIRNGAWESLPYGTPHPRNQNAKLVWQGPVKGNDAYKVAKRIYATERSAQDAYNYKLTFENQDNAFPTFQRTYLLYRTTYRDNPATKGDALLVPYLIYITNPGSGYIPTSPPLVTIGGAGSGATAVAQVNGDGTISGIILTNCGGNYTTVTVTIAAPASGTTATATALLQPSTCVLVTEEKDEFWTKRQESAAIEPEIAALFVSVRRTYQTLPGPVQTSLIADPETKQVITETRQLVRDGTVTPSLATAGGLEVIKDAVMNKEGIVSEHVKQTLPTAVLPGMGWVEYEDIEFTFPTLFYNFVYSGVFAGAWAFRPSFSKRCKAKVTYIFRDGDADEGITPVDIIPSGWSYPFGFSMRGALTNGETITMTVGSSTFTATLPASNPLRAEYEASWIGSYKIIAGSTKRWRGNIFVTKQIEIKML